MSTPATTNRLVFLHLHGFGPASIDFRDRFLERIRGATRDKLADAALAERGQLVMPELRWDKLFKDAKDNWLESLFPDEFRLLPAQQQLAAAAPAGAAAPPPELRQPHRPLRRILLALLLLLAVRWSPCPPEAVLSGGSPQ